MIGVGDAVATHHRLAVSARVRGDNTLAEVQVICDDCGGVFTSLALGIDHSIGRHRREPMRRQGRRW